MHLLSFITVEWLVLGVMAMLQVDDDTRDELRKYKAQDGLTYSEAIERLLDCDGWYDE